MDIREKLVELIYQNSPRLVEEEAKSLATRLIANGVTVQEWIPVSERLPERTMPPHDVLVYHDLNCGMYIDRAWYSHEKNKWRNVLGMNLKVTHWMPLPEPPEEEEKPHEKTDD